MDFVVEGVLDCRSKTVHYIDWKPSENDTFSVAIGAA